MFECMGCSYHKIEGMFLVCGFKGEHRPCETVAKANLSKEDLNPYPSFASWCIQEDEENDLTYPM